MANHEDIKAFLQGLDPKNDDLFTGQGLVKMDIVKAQFGEDVTREEVTSAWPDFDRAALVGIEQDETLEEVESLGKSDVQRLNDELGDLEKQQFEIAKALKAKQDEATQAIEQEKTVGQMHQADQVRLMAQENQRIDSEKLKEDLKKLMEKLG